MNTLSKVDIRLIKLSIIKLTKELHKKNKMYLTKQSPPFSVVSTLLINVFDTMHDVNVKCKQLHSLPFKSTVTWKRLSKPPMIKIITNYKSFETFVYFF